MGEVMHGVVWIGVALLAMRALVFHLSATLPD